MNIYDKRLLKLAEFLDRVPDERYIQKLYTLPGFTANSSPDDGCGSAGCALAWAATIEEFQQLGLVLVGKYCPVPMIRGRQGESLGSKQPAEFLFNLTCRQASLLFGGTVERTAQREAELIREFVAERSGLSAGVAQAGEPVPGPKDRRSTSDQDRRYLPAPPRQAGAECVNYEPQNCQGAAR